MKNKQYKTKLVAVSIGMIFATGVIHAATINVDFNTTGSHETSDIIYSGTAADADSGTVWNGVGINHGGTFDDGQGGFVTADVVNQALVNSNGNNTSYTLSLTNSNDTVGPDTLGAFASEAGNAVIVPGQYDLMRDFLTHIGDDSSSVVTLLGLNAGAVYDFHLYGAGDNADAGSRDTVFTLAGANSLTSSTDGAVNAANGLTLGEEFTTINGVIADGAGQITITFTKDGAGEGTFNGFQMTEAIPEPSSTALLLGGVALLALRRRRQS